MNHPDNENPEINVPQELKEKYFKCRKIVEQALQRAKISQTIIPTDEIPPNKRWVVYYELSGNEIVLTIQSVDYYMKYIHRTPLIGIAWHIVSELESLFSDEKARRLLVVETKEVDEVIIEEATELLRNFILHLPTVLFHNNFQTLKESTINYIKKFVEPRLKEHWQDQKEGSNFSLLSELGTLKDIERLFPNTELHLINTLEWTDDEFLNYRKAALSDKKVLLRPEIKRNLPSEYDDLRQKYSTTKKQYKTKKKAFFEVNKSASIDEWNKFWEDYCEKECDELYFANEVNNSIPSELAYRQLGEYFSYSWEYMQKMVTKERKKLKEEKNTDN